MASMHYMCLRPSVPGIIVLLFLLSFISEQPLKAYVDPGSGTMYVQVILCGLLGGIFQLRKITRWIRRKKQ
jgi:hypothetical protein